MEASAEALTRDRSWVTHDQLSIGDEILAYDPATDATCWEPVTDLYRHEGDTELIHWKSGRIDIKTARITAGGHWRSRRTSDESRNSCPPSTSAASTSA
jgi:hypothetical protein